MVEETEKKSPTKFNRKEICVGETSIGFCWGVGWKGGKPCGMSSLEGEKKKNQKKNMKGLEERGT